MIEGEQPVVVVPERQAATELGGQAVPLPTLRVGCGVAAEGEGIGAGEAADSAMKSRAHERANGQPILSQIEAPFKPVLI